MQPAPTLWPRNAWYVAAMSDQLTDRPLAREVCAEPMVLFRSGTTVAALEDFCPHRGAPLSLGFLRDDALVCGYHGLAVPADGANACMPGQRPGLFPPVRAYPAVERHGFIWVYPGDPSQADAAQIPDLPWSNDENWAFGGGMFEIACDYRLMIDNLMDLSHETYVHANSIGQKEIDEAPVLTTMEGNEVVARRLMHNIPAPPFWRTALRGAKLADDVPVDRWQICRFSLPSHVLIDVGVAHVGQGGVDATENKVGAVVTDFITPRTESSIWYFWGMARSFAPADTALTDTIRTGQTRIFAEDLEMLERQQRNLVRVPERRLMTLNIDTGGTLARRMIEKAIQTESPGSAGVRADNVAGRLRDVQG